MSLLYPIDQLVDRLTTSPPSTAEFEELATSSGLHLSCARRLVSLWLEGGRRTASARLVSPPLVGRVGIVAPSNLFVAAWQPALEALNLGCRVVMRASDRDRSAGDVLKRWLARCLPELGQRFHLTSFDRGDDVSWGQFFAAVDAVIVQGGEVACAAIAQLRDAHRPELPLRLQGHRVSLGWVRGEPSTTLAADMALDALLADGRGCMSPRLFLHRGPMSLSSASRWLDALEQAVVQSEGLARVDGAELSPVSSQGVELHRFEAAMNGGGVLRRTVAGAEVMIRWGPGVGSVERRHLSPAGRHLWLIPVEGSLATCLSSLAALRCTLVWGAAREEEDVARAAELDALQGWRVDAIGRAQGPPWNVTSEGMPLGTGLQASSSHLVD